MRLTHLNVSNYRALEDVRLDDLGSVNVFVGHNNVGKSTVARAIRLIAEALAVPPDSVQPSTLIDRVGTLTHRELERTATIVFTFETGEELRAQLLQAIYEGAQQEQASEQPVSALFQSVRFTFEAIALSELQNTPLTVILRSLELTGFGGEWASIRLAVGRPGRGLFLLKMLDLTKLVKRPGAEHLTLETTDIQREDMMASPVDGFNQQYYLGRSSGYERTSVRVQTILFEAFAEKLKHSFFFSPVRQSIPKTPIQETSQLSRDGANLAQVLHTVFNNDDVARRRIEAFMDQALPDVGRILTRVVGTETEVHFQAPGTGYSVRLDDLGSGVEQLLMVATVLSTAPAGGLLFLDEPESHLHPGAQRYLAARLAGGEHQVFLSTHSSVFVNDGGSGQRVYRVTRAAGRTQIAPAIRAEELATALTDLGVRNSDVLLSDAVLFVEGPSDRQVLQAWAHTLGIRLSGLRILVTNGADQVHVTSTSRSQVLSHLSAIQPIPHLFLIDRDQRTEAEVERLQRNVGGQLHVLKRRELENYLLVPRALLAALKGGRVPGASLDSVTPEDLAQQISDEVAGLYGLVLLKRVRATLNALYTGAMHRDEAELLVAYAIDADLPSRVSGVVSKRLAPLLNQEKIKSLVEDARSTLDGEWAETSRRTALAPGEEILTGLYRRYGVQFNKGTDGERIARKMTADEIDPEIRELLHRMTTLALMMSGEK